MATRLLKPLNWQSRRFKFVGTGGRQGLATRTAYDELCLNPMIC